MRLHSSYPRSYRTTFTEERKIVNKGEDVEKRQPLPCKRKEKTKPKRQKLHVNKSNRGVARPGAQSIETEKGKGNAMESDRSKSNWPSNEPPRENPSASARKKIIKEHQWTPVVVRVVTRNGRRRKRHVWEQRKGWEMSDRGY